MPRNDMCMNIFKLETIQVLPITLSEAWDFFSNPLNLAQITPPELGLQIKGHFDEKVHNGMLIEYTVRPLFGIPLPWLSEIKHVVEPFSFVDEQKVGPYKLWYHYHAFKQVEGGVEVKDIVHYALPLSLIAPLLNHLIVRQKLERIFSYRREVLNVKFKR